MLLEYKLIIRNINNDSLSLQLAVYLYCIQEWLVSNEHVSNNPFVFK